MTIWGVTSLKWANRIVHALGSLQMQVQPCGFPLILFLLNTSVMLPVVAGRCDFEALTYAFTVELSYTDRGCTRLMVEVRAKLWRELECKTQLAWNPANPY
jgi:hypothetical protein